MGKQTEFTWRYVAKSVATGPLDSEIRSEAWQGLKAIGYALAVLVVRVATLLSFPVSVPVLVFVMRKLERDQDSRRAARRAAMDADV